MALTATASERVQRDIVQQLRLREPLMLRASFNRPNIRYEGAWRGGPRREAVREATGAASMHLRHAHRLPCGLPSSMCLPGMAHLSTPPHWLRPAVRYLELLGGLGGAPPESPLPDILALLQGAATGSSSQQQPGEQQHQQQQLGVPCSVIYCHRREDADRVAGALRRRGIAAAAYHAGLPDATRARVLDDWQARRLAVVAATVAFGMGIDRAGGLRRCTGTGPRRAQAQVPRARDIADVSTL